MKIRRKFPQPRENGGSEKLDWKLVGSGWIYEWESPDNLKESFIQISFLPPPHSLKTPNVVPFGVGKVSFPPLVPGNSEQFIISWKLSLTLSSTQQGLSRSERSKNGFLLADFLQTQLGLPNEVSTGRNNGKQKPNVHPLNSKLGLSTSFISLPLQSLRYITNRNGEQESRETRRHESWSGDPLGLFFPKIQPLPPPLVYFPIPSVCFKSLMNWVELVCPPLSSSICLLSGDRVRWDWG